MLNRPSLSPKTNANKIVKIAIWDPLDIQIDRRALNLQLRTADDVDLALPNRKGFQGVVKKHGFAGQPAAHGSKTHRRNGAIGNRSTPGRVWRNMGMPGHMGDDRVTVQNLRIVQVRPEENVILVCGAVPGSNGSYVVVRPAKKRQETDGGKAE